MVSVVYTIIRIVGVECQQQDDPRVRWTFNPFGDLFIVYNHALRTRDPFTVRHEVAFGSNQLLAKVQYAFRY